MKITPILIILSTTLLQTITSLFIQIDPNDNKCLSQLKRIEEIFGVVYFTSGESEKENSVQVKDPFNNILWENRSQNTGTYTGAATKNGLYTFCVQNLSPKQITVTFEFTESSPEQQILSVQSIDSLNTVVAGIRTKMDTIHFNIRNTAVRRHKHSEIAKSINSKITKYTTIKVIFLIVFSVFQIMMVTSIFKNMKDNSKIRVNDNQRGGSTTANMKSKEEDASMIL